MWWQRGGPILLGLLAAGVVVAAFLPWHGGGTQAASDDSGAFGGDAQPTAADNLEPDPSDTAAPDGQSVRDDAAAVDAGGGSGVPAPPVAPVAPSAGATRPAPANPGWRPEPVDADGLAVLPAASGTGTFSVPEQAAATAALAAAALVSGDWSQVPLPANVDRPERAADADASSVTVERVAVVSASDDLVVFDVAAGSAGDRFDEQVVLAPEAGRWVLLP